MLILVEPVKPPAPSPKRMETVDDEILDNALKFVGNAKRAGKPFFLWLNPTRMHVVTHLSDKYEKMRTPENGWSVEEAGMAQFDDIVGSVLRYLKDQGLEARISASFGIASYPDHALTPEGLIQKADQAMYRVKERDKNGIEVAV